MEHINSRKKATLNAEKEKDIASTLNNIGNCPIHLYNCDNALTYLNRALQNKVIATLNAENDRSIASTPSDIGKCDVQLYNCDIVLKYLIPALQIYQNYWCFFMQIVIYQ